MNIRHLPVRLLHHHPVHHLPPPTAVRPAAVQVQTAILETIRQRWLWNTAVNQCQCRNGSSALHALAQDSAHMLNAVVVDGIILEIECQPALCVMVQANVRLVLAGEGRI